MSIALGDVTVNATVVERTFRVEIDCTKGTDFTIQGYREAIATDDQGRVVSRDVRATVTRRLSLVKDETHGGMTIDQLKNLIASVFDTWRQEDMDTAGQPLFPVPPPPPPPGPLVKPFEPTPQPPPPEVPKL